MERKIHFLESFIVILYKIQYIFYKPFHFRSIESTLHHKFDWILIQSEAHSLTYFTDGMELMQERSLSC